MQAMTLDFTLTFTADEIAGELGEHPQQGQVTLIQRRVGIATETAKRAVQGAIG